MADAAFPVPDALPDVLKVCRLHACFGDDMQGLFVQCVQESNLGLSYTGTTRQLLLFNVAHESTVMWSISRSS